MNKERGPLGWVWLVIKESAYIARTTRRIAMQCCCVRRNITLVRKGQVMVM